MNLIIIAILIAVAIALIGFSLLSRNEERTELVRRRSAGLTAEDDPGSIKVRARDRAAKNRMFEMAAPFLSRPVMPKNAAEQSTLRAKLASAGYRKESAATLFLASKTAFAAIGCIVGAAVAYNKGKDSSTTLGYAICGLGLGLMAPSFWLSSVIGRRVEAIRNGLADALDLMVVGVEAGLGLDAAMLRVADEMVQVHPQLAEELQISMIETQMGVTRAESLTKLAERTAVPEMRALVATIVQAEKLGTSIAKALRTQADTLRTKRRQKAEERAQQTAVKLLIPLILFIFPTIFIVLAGPAAIQLMKTFGGAGVSK